MNKNRQWVLKQRPTAMVGPEHFELLESAMPEPDLAAGDVAAQIQASNYCKLLIHKTKPDYYGLLQRPDLATGTVDMSGDSCRAGSG